MNVDFLIVAADSLYKKAEADAAKGFSSAKAVYTSAAKKYRQIADLDASRKNEFLAKAEECEAKAQQDVAKVTYVTPGKEPAKQVNTNGANQQQNQQQGEKVEAKRGANINDADLCYEFKGQNVKDYLVLESTEVVTFDDVLGMKDEKDIIKNEFFISDEDRAFNESIGRKNKNFILLYGLPGTGKTFFAKAISYELGKFSGGDLPFISVACNQMTDKFVGEGEKRIEAIFEFCRQFDRCVLFMDEFESIALTRQSEKSKGNTVSSLLTNIDGFNSNKGLLLIASTNTPYDIDGAVLSRANEQIEIPLPGKELIFKTLKRKIGSLIDDSVNLDSLADKLIGYSNRDVSNFINKALDIYSQDHREHGRGLSKEEFRLNIKHISEALTKVHSSIKLDEVQKLQEYKRQMGIVEDNNPKSKENEIVKLCIKLESVLKNKYGLDGDLYNMVENYIQGYAKDRNEYNVLHKLRMKRNNIVHSENNNVIFTDNDFDKCRIIITVMEEANVSNANTYSGNITINQQNVSAVADAQKESKPVAYKQNSKNNYANYFIPYKEMLKVSETHSEENPAWLEEKKQKINATLDSFGVDGEIISYTKGPTFTLYEIMLASGVNVKKVTQIKDNLAMCLAAKSLRIMAPIPGKATVGIEAPNDVRDSVAFGDIISDDFVNDGKPLNVAIGKYIDNSPVYQNIAEMPHALIAGATQSGKSVSINTMICSLILKNSPEHLKLILVDPKRVEFTFYEKIPHLACPIITDPELANRALKWLENEMERRYNILSENRTRNINDYNKKREEYKQLENLPYIVVIIDEFNDLIMQSGAEVNDSIVRLAQKARACGIHVILATQRPTTNVISGTIKANIPCRISFRVAQAVDSMTILDEGGAEDLLGKGDMLFKNNSIATRAQGAYVSDKEIDSICDYLREKYQPDYMFNLEDI